MLYYHFDAVAFACVRRKIVRATHVRSYRNIEPSPCFPSRASNHFGLFYKKRKKIKLEEEKKEIKVIF